MAVASAALELPRVPKDGMYHRMMNPVKRFKNGMKMQLLDSIAIFEIPRSRPRKVPRTLTLKKETENSCIIDWRQVNPEWHPARLQYEVRDGVEGMLEDGHHFWKLYREYSRSEVATLVMQHKLPSPLPQLEDAVDASTAASAAPDVAETHSSGEDIVFTSEPIAQRCGGAREWLDGHAHDLPHKSESLG